MTTAGRHHRVCVATSRRPHPHILESGLARSPPLPIILCVYTSAHHFRWIRGYDRLLERSACVACPFQSRQRWVETKRRWPELFAEAVKIDARLRDGLALDKTPYLHMLRRPLRGGRP